MSTTVRALDAISDWTFGAGLSNYKSGNPAIAQDIQTRLSTFLGECFVDVTLGVDWWNLLGGKNQALINLQCSTIILNTAGVTGIIQLSSNLDRSTRNLTISYNVSTIYQGVVSGTVFLLTDENGNLLTSNFEIPLEGSGS